MKLSPKGKRHSHGTCATERVSWSFQELPLAALAMPCEMGLVGSMESDEALTDSWGRWWLSQELLLHSVWERRGALWSSSHVGHPWEAEATASTSTSGVRGPIRAENPLCSKIPVHRVHLPHGTDAGAWGQVRRMLQVLGKSSLAFPIPMHPSILPGSF